MNLWEFIAIVSVVSIVAGVFQTWIKSRNNNIQSKDDNLKQQAYINDLEERIKILEAIVTDSKYDLNQKFNDLNRKESA